MEAWAAARREAVRHGGPGARAGRVARGDRGAAPSLALAGAAARQASCFEGGPR